MGSKPKNIITKRFYDFANIKGVSTLETVALRSVDVSYGEKAELLVRVHSSSIGATSAVKVVAAPVNITPEEPDVDYLGDPVATVTINSGVSAPALSLASFTAPFGTSVQVRVIGTCASAGPESIEATISVDLVCKD